MTDQISKLNKAATKIDLTSNFRTIPSKPNIISTLDRLYELRKHCLEGWVKTGYLTESTKKIAELGYRNRHGQQFQNASVRKYALEFILYYPDEARKIYQESYEFPDTPQADEEWLWHIINIAVRQIKSKQHFIRWTLQKKFYKKAFHLFKDLYNLTDADYNAYDDILEHDKQE